MAVKVKLALLGLIIVVTSIFLVRYFTYDNQVKSHADTNPSVLLSLDQSAGKNVVTVKAKATGAVNIIGFDFKVFFSSSTYVSDITYLFGASPAVGLGDSNTNLAAVNARSTDSGRYVRLFGEVTGSPSPLSTTYQDVAKITFTTDVSGQMVTVPADTSFSFIAFDTTTYENKALLITSGALSLSGNSSSSISSTANSSSQASSSSSSTASSSSSSAGSETSSSSSSSSSQSAGNVTLNLKLTFQGIVTTPIDTTAQSVKVAVVKEGEAIGDYLTGGFTANAQGVWSGSVTTDLSDFNSKYYVYVKGPKQLQKKFCDATPQLNSQGYYSCSKANIILQAGSNNLDFSRVVLLDGDLPQQGSAQNGVIDAYDISYIRQHIENHQYEANCDINLDKQCNAQDWALILASMSVKYDD
ncbi:hypothetical protein M1523_01260 [Patescibacteria group bacterium]|nr:hypothetical protein [Patescibacteria group bacterium]MCL5091980.1 hypothetical protein [Patescibacteria group bacterium]